MSKTKVLVIDDSAIVRDILSRRLAENPKLEVVGTAPDPFIARNKIESMDIDVVTLDIEMPRMDGLTFLKYLMKYKPMPVIIVSSLTEGKNQAALEAMERGAVDIVNKTGGPFSVEEIAEELAEKIIAASRVSRSNLKKVSLQIQKNAETQPATKRTALSQIQTTQKLLVVGASTGGTIAMEAVFTKFTVDYPPTLAVIHMPEHFTASFAARLNTLCQVEVKEAKNGELIMPSTIYIAPGNYHMMVETSGAKRIIRIKDGPRMHGQRPAVDILFNSAAEKVGKNCIAVLMTGMGRDGAIGMKNVKEAGGYTIAQDEASSIVFGMPKEAIAIGGASEISSLDAIPQAIKKRI